MAYIRHNGQTEADSFPRSCISTPFEGAEYGGPLFRRQSWTGIRYREAYAFGRNLNKTHLDAPPFRREFERVVDQV